MSDDLFMREALSLAQSAELLGEVPIGAVVVKDGVVLGRGYNRPISARDPTAHAEVIAMRDAAAQTGNYRLVDCEIYVTLEPCAMCAGAIMHARLSRLVYAAPDPKTAACGSVVDLFSESRLNHHASVTAGVLAQDCGNRLRQFFSDRRRRDNS